MSGRLAAGRRVVLSLLPLLVLGAAPPVQPIMARPMRIMSINLCSDLALLMLVPKQRITSITYVAHDAVRVLMPGSDRGIAINHGAAEEILRDKPDLILASAWTGAAARRLARRVGANVVEMESTSDFADIRRFMRHLGAAVGEPARAEALLRGMDDRLRALDATRPGRALRVVAWSGGGTAPGRGTLTDAIIGEAGAINIAAGHRDGRYTGFDLEQLLAARPDAVLQGVASHDAPSLHRGLARHPLIDRLFAGRQVDFPEAAYACGLPQSADAAADLRRTLARVAVPGPRW